VEKPASLYLGIDKSGEIDTRIYIVSEIEAKLEIGKPRPVTVDGPDLEAGYKMGAYAIGDQLCANSTVCFLDRDIREIVKNKWRDFNKEPRTDGEAGHYPWVCLHKDVYQMVYMTSFSALPVSMNLIQQERSIDRISHRETIAVSVSGNPGGSPFEDIPSVSYKCLRRALDNTLFLIIRCKGR
jgi:hypothetical protein